MGSLMSAQFFRGADGRTKASGCPYGLLLFDWFGAIFFSPRFIGTNFLDLSITSSASSIDSRGAAFVHINATERAWGLRPLVALIDKGGHKKACDNFGNICR